jgi:hypothetical protein
VVVTVLVLLSMAAPALAWRPSSHTERLAISRAARLTPHAGNSTVKVSGIRVSTVGPWASAGLTIEIDNYPDYATDILHKVHGKWINVGAGTAGEWCVMPRKDIRNLGFSLSYQC